MNTFALNNNLTNYQKGKLYDEYGCSGYLKPNSLISYNHATQYPNIILTDSSGTARAFMPFTRVSYYNEEWHPKANDLNSVYAFPAYHNLINLSTGYVEDVPTYTYLNFDNLITSYTKLYQDYIEFKDNSIDYSTIWCNINTSYLKSSIETKPASCSGKQSLSGSQEIIGRTVVAQNEQTQTSFNILTSSFGQHLSQLSTITFDNNNNTASTVKLDDKNNFVPTISYAEINKNNEIFETTDDETYFNIIKLGNYGAINGLEPLSINTDSIKTNSVFKDNPEFTLEQMCDSLAPYKETNSALSTKNNAIKAIYSNIDCNLTMSLTLYFYNDIEQEQLSDDCVTSYFTKEKGSIEQYNLFDSSSIDNNFLNYAVEDASTTNNSKTIDTTFYVNISEFNEFIKKHIYTDIYNSNFGSLKSEVINFINGNNNNGNNNNDIIQVDGNNVTINYGETAEEHNRAAEQLRKYILTHFKFKLGLYSDLTDSVDDSYDIIHNCAIVLNETTLSDDYNNTLELFFNEKGQPINIGETDSQHIDPLLAHSLTINVDTLSCWLSRTKINQLLFDKVLSNNDNGKINKNTIHLQDKFSFIYSKNLNIRMPQVSDLLNMNYYNHDIKVDIPTNATYLTYNNDQKFSNKFNKTVNDLTINLSYYSDYLLPETNYKSNIIVSNSPVIGIKEDYTAPTDNSSYADYQLILLGYKKDTYNKTSTYFAKLNTSFTDKLYSYLPLGPTYISSLTEKDYSKYNKNINCNLIYSSDNSIFVPITKLFEDEPDTSYINNTTNFTEQDKATYYFDTCIATYSVGNFDVVSWKNFYSVWYDTDNKTYTYYRNTFLPEEIASTNYYHSVAAILPNNTSYIWKQNILENEINCGYDIMSKNYNNNVSFYNTYIKSLTKSTSINGQVAVITSQIGSKLTANLNISTNAITQIKAGPLTQPTVSGSIRI